MTQLEYLRAVLAAQRLHEGSGELARLTDTGAEITAVLREIFGSAPVIRPAGSRAKGTLIRIRYDLDLLCYFPRDEQDAGATLAELYRTVVRELRKGGYAVTENRSSIRVTPRHREFFVDVVPGRYIDARSGDVFLHQTSGDKERLMTNPELHITHVQDSGRIDEIRLAKIWSAREALRAKTFVLELAVIQLLDGVTGDLVERVIKLFELIHEKVMTLVITDPANGNNDLSSVFDKTARLELKECARLALLAGQRGDWQAVFGAVNEHERSGSPALVQSAVAALISPVKPWGQP